MKLSATILIPLPRLESIIADLRGFEYDRVFPDMMCQMLNAVH